MRSRPFVEIDEVARECFNHTVALFWGEPDGNTPLRSATGFLIELDGHFLITARHVIQTFLETHRVDNSVVLKVGKGIIDRVSQRATDWNDNIDLIALNLSGIDVKSFQTNCRYFKPKRWPPKKVADRAQVFFIGFVVDGQREVLHETSAIYFPSFSASTQVDKVSTLHFTCVINMANVQRNAPPGARWPTEYGGLSGSPVFVIWEDVGLELIGMVYEANNSFNMIRAHHCHLISSMGTF